MGRNREGCVLPVGVNQEEGRLGQANNAEVTQDLCVAPATTSIGFLALKRADGGQGAPPEAGDCVRAEHAVCERASVWHAHLIYFK